MHRSIDNPGRREFLKVGTVAAAGGSLLASGGLLGSAAALADTAAETPAAETPAAGKIPERPFGKTGHTLPVLGMGGSAMVQVFIQAYGAPLPELDARVAMVRHAFDRGVRYFDTARVYGESELIMGRGLKGVRDQCFVATKCHAADPAQVRASVEKSLEQLGMDHVDLVQVHSPCIEAVGVNGAMKIHAELVKLRDEKLLRFIGLTTHVAFEDVLTMIETDAFDQVLLAYGYLRRGMNTILSNAKIEYREQCLAAAHERGMAIVAMKILGANMLSHNAPKMVADATAQEQARLPGAAIRWVLQDPRVSMLNVGVSVPSDIDQNVQTLLGDTTLTNADRQLLADFSARLYACETVRAMPVS